MTVDPRTADRIDALGRWVAARGGSAPTGEAGAALGFDPNQQAAAVRGLRAAGLAKPGRLLVELTPLGLARFGGMERGSAGRVLDEVLDGWPAGHRAFVELAVCAVIARHHLRAERPSPHVGFMAMGGTGAGKSAMGVLVCRLFGLDPIAMTRQMPTMTENPLGRKVQGEGSSWRFQPSALARQPFALLDELDKADTGVQKATWPVFDGSATLFIEDAAHDIAPTPMVTANPPTRGTDRFQNLPEHARRRSVVFDVGSASDYTREDVRRFGDVYEHQLAPNQQLALAALRPPAALSLSTREWLEEAAQHFLTDKGCEEFPGVAALELLTRGRLSMLNGEVNEQFAAAHTFAAYLAVTETMPGQVDPEGAWAQVLSDWCRENPDIGGAQSLAAAVSRFSAARAAAGAKAVHGKRTKARADGAILEAGAVLASRCSQAFDALDGHKLTHASSEQKAAAQGLRRLLRDYRGRAGKVSTAIGLAEVTDLAADPIARAKQLRAQVDRARIEVETNRREHVRERQQEREADKQRTAWEAQQRRAHRSNRATGLTQVRAEAKPLEILWNRRAAKSGESPLTVLARLRVDGRALLTYRPPAAEERPRGWAVLTYQRPLGWWIIAGTNNAGYQGTQLACAALNEWGQGTRAVLAPTLAHLHGLEDQLVHDLGRKPRQRPDVSSSPSRAIEARRT
jgi:hypothetical protein